MATSSCSGVVAEVTGIGVVPVVPPAGGTFPPWYGRVALSQDERNAWPGAVVRTTARRASRAYW